MMYFQCDICGDLIEAETARISTMAYNVAEGLVRPIATAQWQKDTLGIGPTEDICGGCLAAIAKALMTRRHPDALALLKEAFDAESEPANDVA